MFGQYWENFQSFSGTRFRARHGLGRKVVFSMNFRKECVLRHDLGQDLGKFSNKSCIILTSIE